MWSWKSAKQLQAPTTSVLESRLTARRIGRRESSAAVKKLTLVQLCMTLESMSSISLTIAVLNDIENAGIVRWWLQYLQIVRIGFWNTYSTEIPARVCSEQNSFSSFKSTSRSRSYKVLSKLHNPWQWWSRGIDYSQSLWGLLHLPVARKASVNPQS